MATMHSGRRRMCGRKTVLLGQKPLLVGGAAEGNAFRNFAYNQVGAMTRSGARYRHLVVVFS